MDAIQFHGAQSEFEINWKYMFVVPASGHASDSTVLAYTQPIPFLDKFSNSLDSRIRFVKKKKNPWSVSFQVCKSDMYGTIHI